MEILGAIFFGVGTGVFLLQLRRPEFATRLGMSRQPRGRLIILSIVSAAFALAFLGSIVHKISSDGRQLYDYYKDIDGNADRPGYDEQEYVRGKLLSRCKVNGKSRGYFGWFDIRTVLIEGERVKNDTPTRMYIFALTGDDGQVSAIWRGEEYKQAVIDQMMRTCD